MRLSSVFAARAVWFLDIEELNPHGRRIFPDIIPAMVAQFEFSEVPQNLAQMDPTDKAGIAFRNGKFPIDEASGELPVAFDFEIHGAGLAVQTKDNTDASEHILEQIINWAVRNFGINFDFSMIRRKAYVSQIVFYPDQKIVKGLQKFNEFAELLSKTTLSNVVQRRELASLLFKAEGSDRWAFTFERRAGAPFAENKYFSSCDATTEVHLDLIEKFENLLST